MKLELVTLGNKPPGWVKEGVEEYRRRMPKECALQLREIAIPRRTKNASPARNKTDEAQKIAGAKIAGARVIALDLTGKIWSTEEVAARLRGWMNEYTAVQFVIGGPDGLDDSVVTSADEVWSLSRLTFPHFIVPILISEQLYRAWTVINGHPYHR